MNRRSFLKKIAAVATGVVVLPTAVKKLSFKPNPVQVEWMWIHAGYSYNKNEINRMCSTIPVENRFIKKLVNNENVG